MKPPGHAVNHRNRRGRSQRPHAGDLTDRLYGMIVLLPFAHPAFNRCDLLVQANEVKTLRNTDILSGTKFADGSLIALADRTA